jgi:YVTN family beta-propeller protein
MKMNKKLCSVALASTAIVLFLILTLSITSAATAQGTSNAAKYAYITNSGSTTVSVIDTATNKVTATVNVGSNPYGVAVNPKGTKVYVASDVNDAVSVIDTATNKVTATVPVGSDPWGIAVNPDGTKVYVANEGSGTVSVIDTASNKVTATIKVGNYPYGIAVNPAGTKVYAVNDLDNTVSVIDAATNKVTATITVGDLPTGVAVNPAGTKVYVTNERDVSVIDTATNKVTATVPVGKYPWGVAINPTGTKAYVTNYGDSTVSVIDTATNKVTATVKVGSYPLGIAINPEGTKVYVANEESNTISVIDTATNKITATITVGKEPVAFGKFIGSVSVQNPVIPDANFVGSPVSGSFPLKVQFTDKSTGSPTSWKWNFGDGSDLVTEYNPTHTYSKAGTYTVKETVSNAAGKDTEIKTNYITVTETSKVPDANFVGSPVSGSIPLKVQFTDKSTNNPTAWKWNFGDGSDLVTEYNPTHTYSKAGTYTVKETVSNAAGKDTEIKTNYITVTEASKIPDADFVGSPISGSFPLKVQFTDRSTNSPTAWKWNFGDGSDLVTEYNPTHTYSKAGTYTVKETVSNAAGKDTEIKTNYITVTEASKAPDANFVGSPVSGNIPLKVQFTDKSTGSPTSWKWNFGDGSDLVTEYNPTHTYSKAGTYTVKETVSNAAGKDTEIKTNYITVTSVTKPVAAFSASPTSGNLPLSVTFTDKSTNSPISWKWNFGDGTSSTARNPTHKYSAEGKYTVTLTATNSAGSNTVTKSNYITVTATSQAPVADFWGSPLSGKAPLKVTFTEASKGSPTTWRWDFGDGTYSTQKSPVHTYSAAGTYTVKLTAINTAGSNTKTKWNYVKVSEASQIPVASFSSNANSGNAPLSVTFTDTSTGSPTSWKWNFGDGTYSTVQNPTHKYSAAGKYTVTLTASNTAESNTVAKSNYITVTETSQAPVADFWGWPLSGKAALEVAFTETSTGSPTSWKWDFGDGKFSTEKSPKHKYSAAGNYTVKLTVTNAAGSSTKTKYKYVKVTL